MHACRASQLSPYKWTRCLHLHCKAGGLRAGEGVRGRAQRALALLSIFVSSFFVCHTLQWIFQLGPHQLYAWWNKHWQLLYICKGPYSSCAYLTTHLWIRAWPQLGLQRERERERYRENERGRIAMGNPTFPPHHVPCSLQQNKNTNASPGCFHQPKS